MVGNASLLTVLPAHSLRHLHLQQVQGREGPAVSAALARLSNLQQLRIDPLQLGGPLQLPGRRGAVGSADVTRDRWFLLRELAVHFPNQGPSNRQWQAILNGVAASTNLTQLALYGTCKVDGDNHEGGGLTNLKELSITCSQLLPPGDALALTALTGLTRLVLKYNGAGVGDEAATALAGSCQQLRHLDVSYCSLVSMACLANVAHLPQLTELTLGGNSGLTQQGLMLLTGLKQLKHLSFD
ncbi:hypothetical protein COO60DRAFT_1643165 [Scenedesmus sp. NREL 46B-D3]|nr:hypothetical protein COO60DRAFT_1643165 [Scenedesmus sp. NREL 46B-D3]